MPQKTSKASCKVALVYDFDGTLSPGNMQENSLFGELNVEKESFWKETNRMAEERNMDQTLAYMYLLLDKEGILGSSRKRLGRNMLLEHGKNLKFFPGVQQWFSHVNRFAQTRGIDLEHYIISAGLREMIRASGIGEEFTYIFASDFVFDEKGYAIWPSVAINYTTKTQYLFRINKRVLNFFDDNKVNEYMTKEDRPIPFDRIIYVGNGQTDIPAMKLVNQHRGHSIALYPSGTLARGSQARQMLTEGRARYCIKADYGPEGALFKVVCQVIENIKQRVYWDFFDPEASP